jgi:hypothetical protein
MVCFFYVAISSSSADIPGNISTDYLVRLNRLETKLSKPFVTNSASSRSFNDYLIQSNQPLFERLRIVSGSEERSLTFVLGQGGIGKSSLIRVLQNRQPEVRMVQLSQLRDKAWTFKDICEEPKPDLTTTESPPLVLSVMPAIRQEISNWLPTVMKRLGADLSKVLLIDDLDEIHPESAKRLLNELEDALRGRLNLGLIRAMVFGRPEAFIDYYNQPAKFDFSDILKIALSVPEDYNTQPFLDAAVNSAIHLGKLSDHSSNVISNTVTVFRLHPELVASMANRTQSQYLIQAVAEGVTDSNEIKRSILNSLLQRAHDSHGRPLADNSAYFDMFVQVAHMYAGQVDEDGFFQPSYQDYVIYPHDGRNLRVKVSALLNRSGLTLLEPAQFRSPKYRFEPFWLHRYLAEKALPESIASKVPEPLSLTLMEMQTVAIVFGIGFILLLFIFACVITIWPREVPDIAILIFRVILSLAAAGIATILPGVFGIQGKVGGLALTAGGAIGFAVLVYAINPPRFLKEKKEAKSVTRGPGDS